MDKISELLEVKPQFLQKEWHLVEINVGYAWKKNIKGKNVTVCVADDGIFYNPDIKIESTKVNPIIEDAEIMVKEQAYLHGTSIGGIVSGKGNKYMIGIAPESKLVSYIILGPLAESISKKYPYHKFILKNKDKIDIFNNSFGPQNEASPNVEEEQTFEILKSIEIASHKGRCGKGNIFVFAAGNENVSGGLASYNLLINHRYTISVGAINSNLDNSTYSNIGLGILCVAPAGRDQTLLYIAVRTPVPSSFDQFGITTTLPYSKDLAKKGLIPYTHDFNGTSAACPMVSGCVALLLEYRPDLTWRDVKEIISRSCYQDYYINSTVPPEDFVFNGNNVLVSQRSGYGIINVKKMIKNAKKWKLLPKEKNASAESEINTTLNLNNKSFTIKLDISKNMIIETVQVYLTVNSKPSVKPQLILNMDVCITSPMGTKLKLINNQVGFLQDPDFEVPEDLQYYDNEPFLCELLRGEKSQGQWKIEFKWNEVESIPDTENILKYVKLDIYGHKKC
ncbi:subtilase family protein [Catovirus CTV1]|uniref:Subtilase family protein n=1 Tax=Catovirus CTV1 TaxID=1977631 RepID=A0A1V0S9L2_9VIRU|nr:subtilase family protein [Catovirus CTV1]